MGVGELGGGGAVPSAKHGMDELLTVRYSFYCSIIFSVVFLAFFHTYIFFRLTV